jgi:hypothetical protein
LVRETKPGYNRVRVTPPSDQKEKRLVALF